MMSVRTVGPPLGTKMLRLTVGQKFCIRCDRSLVARTLNRDHSLMVVEKDLYQSKCRTLQESHSIRHIRHCQHFKKPTRSHTRLYHCVIFWFFEVTIPVLVPTIWSEAEIWSNRFGQRRAHSATSRVSAAICWETKCHHLLRVVHKGYDATQLLPDRHRWPSLMQSITSSIFHDEMLATGYM